MSYSNVWKIQYVMSTWMHGLYEKVMCVIFINWVYSPLLWLVCQNLACFLLLLPSDFVIYWFSTFDHADTSSQNLLQLIRANPNQTPDHAFHLGSASGLLGQTPSWHINQSKTFTISASFCGCKLQLLNT